MSNIIVVARIRATKGKGDALASLLAEQAETVRAAEPGCVTYAPYPVGDPEEFLFYEVYRDQEALDAHMNAPHLAAYRKKRQDHGLAVVRRRCRSSSPDAVLTAGAQRRRQHPSESTNVAAAVTGRLSQCAGPT